MAIVRYNSKEKELLARIMRAEAIGEGNMGMLLVGNVVINRVLADCLSFRSVNSVTDVIYQANQFSGINNQAFFSNPTTAEVRLAEKVLKGEYFFPATNALWFYAPGVGANCSSVWYEQALAGRYKSHCFYMPDSSVCKSIH